MNTLLEPMDRIARREAGYLTMALRLVGLGVCWWNPDSNEMFGSREFCTLHAIDQARTKLTRELLLQRMLPEDRRAFEMEINEAVSERRRWQLDYRIVLPDGAFKYIQGIGQPVLNEAGELLEFVYTTVDITARKQAEEELSKLSGKILRLQDEERRKIAHELHESTGQDLVALATMLTQLKESVRSDTRKSRNLISQCGTVVDRCIREILTLSCVLHPPTLDYTGLEDAIRDYVQSFSKRSGIRVELELPPHLGRLAQDAELTLFRVVQEGLGNIQLHSGSQQAKLRILLDKELRLEISELGQGEAARLPIGETSSHFEDGVGILSMRERLRLIGGQFQIKTTTQGTTINVTMPIAPTQIGSASEADLQGARIAETLNLMY